MTAMKKKGLLWCLWIVAVLFVAVQPAIAEKIRGIKKLHYSTSGTTVNGSEMYELTCGDECTVRIKHKGEPYEEAKTYPISDEQVEEIIDMLNKYEVWRWNGFDEHDPDVFDGSSFSFSLSVQDGKTIEAHGYCMYPENYSEVIQSLLRVFNSLEEDDKDEGNHGGGVLVPVIIGAGVLVIVLLVIVGVRRRK